jgi:hypothetical protein
MITSLTYVSKSCLARSSAALEIDDIVERSSPRNEALAVRGALVFTERHFAQVLEGPKASIDELMASIRRDPRHEAVTVVCHGTIDDYRFQSWTLAYNGGASYMDQQVASLLRVHDGDYDDEALRLYLLIRRLALESLESGPIGRPSLR